MSATNHEGHERVTRESDAQKVLAQLRGGCDECLRNLAELEDPTTVLVELTRVSAHQGFAACPTIEEVYGLKRLTLPIEDLIDVAAHCARCDRCWRTLTEPDFIAEAEATSRAAEQRITQRVESEVTDALGGYARRRRRRIAREVTAITAGAALIAAGWWLATISPTHRPDVRAENRVPARSDADTTTGQTGARYVVRACAPGERRACPIPEVRGPCAIGVEQCAEGVWSRCTPVTPPTAERCDNGVDDDCDGEIDEGCSCRGDLTDLASPADQTTLTAGATVEFRWAPVSCPTRSVLFRVRDLTTQALVVADVAVAGNAHTETLAPPTFLPGHEYRWSVRVEVVGAPNNEYAAQFRTFSVR